MADAAPTQNETVQATTSADTPDPAKKIRVKAFDGSIHVFPAGSSVDAMQRAMKGYEQQKKLEEKESEPDYSTLVPSEGDPQMKAGDVGQMARGVVSGVLGAPGDLESLMLKGTTKLGLTKPSEKPILPSSEDVDQALFDKPADERESGYRKLGGVVGSLASPGAITKPTKLLARGGKAAVTATGRTLEKAFGKGAETAEKAATEAVERLRTQGTRTAEEAATAKEGEATTAESHAERIDRIRKQLQEQQPKVAAQRAEQRKLGPDLTRQKVLAQTRERARQAEADYRAAGASHQQAKDLVLEREARTKAAEEAATALDTQLAARPQTTAEQFGQMVRNATKSIADRYSKIRARESGFGEAIASAGNDARVPTNDIVDMIDAKMKNLRNPTLRNTLVDLRGELLTDDAPKLNIEAAESLRGTLDSIIGSKMFKDRKVDKETLAIVGQIRKELVRAASDAWKPYKDALAKWRTLSRPLDIVERKGALKKVLDVDPVSTDYATTESQVVGEVIKKAQQGNPVFERLLKESPELKGAARLYFSKDLIEGGSISTPAKLATWLKNNERPLQQLGLLDEFKDIQSAKKAAQFAIEEAKGAHTVAVKEAKAAAQKEAEAARQSKIADTVRDMAKKRAETNPTAEVTSRKVVPRSSLEARETPKEAAGRLEGQANKARLTGKEKRAVADDFRQAQAKMTVARADEVPGEVKTFAKRLRDKNYLSNTQYKDYLRQVQQVEDAFKASKQAAADKAKAVHRLKMIGRSAVLAAVGYEAYRVSRDLFGW